jgi:hypothetical protein
MVTPLDFAPQETLRRFTIGHARGHRQRLGHRQSPSHRHGHTGNGIGKGTGIGSGTVTRAGLITLRRLPLGITSGAGRHIGEPPYRQSAGWRFAYPPETGQAATAIVADAGGAAVAENVL